MLNFWDFVSCFISHTIHLSYEIITIYNLQSTSLIDQAIAFKFTLNHPFIIDMKAQ